MLRVWLENAYLRPLNEGLWNLTSEMGTNLIWTPKRHLLAQKHVMRCIDRYDRSIRFWTAHPFIEPKILVYRTFYSVRHPKSVHFGGGICTQSNTWFHRSTQLSIPNSILIGSAVFVQLTAETAYFRVGCHFSPSKLTFREEDLDPI